MKTDPRGLSPREFFWEIWNERPHVSEVSGMRLGPEPLAHYFSHVLPKSTYPKGKFDKDNILLMTFTEHTLWEHNKSKIEGDPMWAPVFEIAERLSEKYNETEKKNLEYMEKYYLNN